MTWWHAIILGIVEGLTEYLPISSTGHLLVVQSLLGIGAGSEQAKAAADAYAVCIQGGAIVAVLTLYWPRFRQMLAGSLGTVGWGRGDEVGRRLALSLVVGFLPAAGIGLVLKDWIKLHLFGPWPVVAAWLVGGVAILAVARWRRGQSAASAPGAVLESLTWRMALVIGLMQCMAMWPGVSRSLVTIVGGVVVGLSLPAAVEFSFLLGVITLGAATVYEALSQGAIMLELYGPLEIGLGFVFAFASAVVAVRWMVTYLQRHGMEFFGYYRVGVAVVVAMLLIAGVQIG